MSVFCNIAKQHFCSLLMWLTCRYDSEGKPLLIRRKVMTIESWHFAVLSNLLALCSWGEHRWNGEQVKESAPFYKSKTLMEWDTEI